MTSREDGAIRPKEGVQFVREFYGQVASQTAHWSDFSNLSDLFNSYQGHTFYDLGHTGPEISPIIGEVIAKKLIERMQKGN